MSAHLLRKTALRAWLDGLVLATIGSLAVWFGWRRWTHPIIDFGRELYVPWQLSAGQTLYTDIAYFNGPLSPHVNAAVFRLFGVSLTALMVVNLILICVTACVLYRLLDRHANRSSALVGTLLFLVMFALADLIGFGNYNFVTPYSHEMTHATLLGLGLLWVLGSTLEQPTRGREVSIGLLLGLIFLTKAEFFLAGLAALGTAALLPPRNRSNRSLSLPLIGAACLVPPLLAFVFLLRDMPATQALIGALGPWPYVFLDELTELVFYRQGLGTDTPIENLRSIALWLGLYALLFVPPWLAGRYLGGRIRQRRWIPAFGVVWVLSLLVLVAPRFQMTHLPRPLPVLLAVAVLAELGGQLASRRRGNPFDPSAIAALTRQVFALVLLAKMVLNTRFHNYGFALALPATMILVELLLYRIPRKIEERGGYGAAFRVPSLAFLILVGVAFAWPSWLVFQQKTTVVGHPPDHLRVQPRYDVVRQLLERLPQHLAPQETLLVLPEGVMLNYQLRVQNPTPHINFMPPEMIMFGESNIVQALAQSPPDVVVFLKRRTIEYGFETIGDGYGESLMAWLAERYPIVETIEDPDLLGKNFGRAFILRHRPFAGAATPDSPEPPAAP